MHCIFYIATITLQFFARQALFVVSYKLRFLRESGGNNAGFEIFEIFEISRMTNGYDGFGQVTSGKKMTLEEHPIPGMDYGYEFDGIGNWKTSWAGSALALPQAVSSRYSVNNVNHYTQRTVPGRVEVTGVTEAPARVTDVCFYSWEGVL
jgi:hypothetical protein